MKSSTAVTAVLILAALCYQVSSMPRSLSISGPCCFTYVKKFPPSSHVTIWEHTNDNCPMPGVIFTTHSGTKFCGNPQDQWVQKILNAGNH